MKHLNILIAFQFLAMPAAMAQKITKGIDSIAIKQLTPNVSQGPIDIITERQMNKGLVTNSLNALSGQAAGVNISSGENRMAQLNSVRVRGTTSLTGGNDPLVIIDGVYSDLATLYERAGMVLDKKGSVTLLPILTMPNDDITHPIPDLTGYITEGQIVLSRDLAKQNVYPPINVLPSLSRLMKDGIGDGFTREDHDEVSSQLFSSYSRVQEVRSLAQIIGEDDLSELDQKFMAFGKAFEERFLTQDQDEKRTIEETLDIAWEILSILPKEELERLSPKMIDKYYCGE